MRTLTTKKNRSVTTTFSDIEAIEIITTLKTNNFAQSLVQQWQKKKCLTSDQWAWVHILANEVRNPTPKLNIQLDASNILNLLTTAKSKLKYPKIHLEVLEQPLVFSIAGSAAKFPGSINISSGGFNSTFYGRIYLDGKFEPSRNCTDEIKNFVIEFAKDPIGIASAFGHRTGNCCFCVKKLTDPRSIEVGYGAICAKHFGLPWGK